MQTWILLLRGINVGGRNLLPMKELKSILLNVGCEEVRTYIQSGNVVLQSAEKRAKKLQYQVQAAIADSCAIKTSVLALTTAQLLLAANNNPFRDGETDPRKQQLYFLDNTPSATGMNELEHLKKKTEQFASIDRVFYLHAPEGIGRSKLAASVEKVLGVTSTARNAQTVSRILELASAK